VTVSLGCLWRTLDRLGLRLKKVASCRRAEPAGRGGGPRGFLLVWFGVNLLLGLGSISMAGVERRLHGRRISAGSLPVTWHSPHSIPF
jgi:hypothetical protein